MLSGISPFQLWIDHGYSWVVNWRQYLRSPVSSELSEVLDKLLKKDFQERYQSADEVLTDLTPQPLPPPPIPPTQPLPPRIQAIPTAPATHSKVLLQLVVLLVLVMVAWFLGYLATQWWRSQLTTNFGTPPTQVEGTDPIGTVPGQVSLSNLDVGFEITSDREIILSKNKFAPNLVFTAPAGSVLRVIEKPIPQQQDSLVHLLVCSVGNKAQLNNSTAQTVKKLSNTKSSTTASTLVKRGEDGWIQLSQLERLNPLISAPGQSGQCQVNSEAAPDVNLSPLQSSPARPPDDDVLPQR